MTSQKAQPPQRIKVGQFIVNDHGDGVLSSTVAGWIGEPHLEQAASGAALAVELVAGQQKAAARADKARQQSRKAAKAPRPRGLMKIVIAEILLLDSRAELYYGWRKLICEKHGIAPSTLSRWLNNPANKIPNRLRLK